MNYRRNEVHDRSSDCSAYLDHSINTLRNVFSSPDPQSPRIQRQIRRHNDRSLNYSPTPVPELDETNFSKLMPVLQEEEFWKEATSQSESSQTDDDLDFQNLIRQNEAMDEKLNELQGQADLILTEKHCSKKNLELIEVGLSYLANLRAAKTRPVCGEPGNRDA